MKDLHRFFSDLHATEETLNTTVKNHYGTGDLVGRVAEALRRAQLDKDNATWSDFVPLDQFHVRGLPASEELAAAMEAKRDAKVLDVGCGLGGSARYLAAVWGCRVTGIDLSGPFIEVARMLTEKSALSDRVSYREGDALDLSFDDESFDFGWTQHVAMNIADRQRLYGNIHRVLKPGARLAIYDVAAGENRPLTYPVPWARTSDQSFLLSPEAMRDVLVGAGFREISWIDSTQAGIEWFEAQQLRNKSAPEVPTLGLRVIMGPDFAEMASNLRSNLIQGRANLIQAVLERI